jgi:hypothetical protein
MSACLVLEVEQTPTHTVSCRKLPEPRGDPAPAWCRPGHLPFGAGPAIRSVPARHPLVASARSSERGPGARGSTPRRVVTHHGFGVRDGSGRRQVSSVRSLRRRARDGWRSFASVFFSI